ncbi:SDR family oxidoreductase [Tunicatimonas pelagia]|uniref:SDR family oxidoreductase n=1 Tax=Tunicatimonas pelagia TaxID=931531 RepID=UPI002666A92A|nr:SDR family oxidoreductase [Tunicatimonas pelagia]WKN43770.1 SDR family oxidoreductase [Tunicatimonas pelagia]
MIKSISVLGCGWLGFPLAKALVAQGYEVLGSTTNSEKLPSLEQAGVRPYLVALSPEINPSVEQAFFRSDVLVVNIPPGRRRDDVEHFYPQQIGEILKQNPTRRIIFVSSTSIYPNLNREVTEKDFLVGESERQSLRVSGRALIAAEQLVQQFSDQATIVRFCGLMGPNRHPGSFLAGKKLNSSGQAPINFIHRDDCVAILLKIIQGNYWGKTFNACADEHPTKEEFYQQATQKIGEQPPQFSSEKLLPFKSISSEKLKKELAYQFKYSDPRDAL